MIACRVDAPVAPPPPSEPAPIVAAAPPAPREPLPPPPQPAPVAPVERPWTERDEPRIVALQPLIHAAAARHGVDPNVINAIIWHESKFHVDARGPGGAAGLMQLMPTTSKGLAKRLGRRHRPYDAAFNVEAGALLVSRLLAIFDGDLSLAIAGYGLGHVAVQRRRDAGEPLPDRTLRFVAKVQAWAPAFATLPCPKGQAPVDPPVCVRP